MLAGVLDKVSRVVCLNDVRKGVLTSEDLPIEESAIRVGIQLVLLRVLAFFKGVPVGVECSPTCVQVEGF